MPTMRTIRKRKDGFVVVDSHGHYVRWSATLTRARHYRDVKIGQKVVMAAHFNWPRPPRCGDSFEVSDYNDDGCNCCSVEQVRVHCDRPEGHAGLHWSDTDGDRIAWKCLPKRPQDATKEGA
jgi:hypothetical protein